MSQRGRAEPLPSLRMSVLLGVAALAVAALVGVVPDAISSNGTLAISSLALAALMAVVLRRSLPAREEGDRVAEVTPGVDAAPPSVEQPGPSLRVARSFFYLGVLTLGEAAFRPGLGLTISEILFLISLGSCGFAVLRGHPIVIVPPTILAGVCVFALGGAISSLAARSQVGSGAQVLHAIYVMLLWVWTGAMVLRTRSQVLTALTCWGLSLAADGVAAMTQAFGIHALGGLPEGHRMVGFTQHPNDLGGASAVAIVPALLLATGLSAGNNLMRAFRWLVVGLIAAGLLLSASVGAMTAAAVGVLVWLSAPVVRASARLAVAAALVAVLAVSLFAGGSVTTPAQRLQLVTSQSGTLPGAGSGQERLSLVKTAWPRIFDNPVVGTGLDASGSNVTIISGAYTVSYQAHGAPLAAWYEAGVFGLLGILFLFVALPAIGWGALGAARTDEELLIAWALFAAFIAFVVYAMTAPLYFQQYGWFAAVALVAWRVHRTSSAGSEAAAHSVEGRWRLAALASQPLPR